MRGLYNLLFLQGKPRKLKKPKRGPVKTVNRGKGGLALAKKKGKKVGKKKVNP